MNNIENKKPQSGRSLLTILGIVVRNSLVRVVLLCSMVAYTAFQITVRVYDPVTEKSIKLYMTVNAFYLGCLHAMHYNGISKKAMEYRCRHLTDYYNMEMKQILEVENE